MFVPYRSMRYNVWRSRQDNALHVICWNGKFECVPVQVRHLGPWIGSKEGDIDRLRPHYRALLAEQGFCAGARAS